MKPKNDEMPESPKLKVIRDILWFMNKLLVAIQEDIDCYPGSFNTKRLIFNYEQICPGTTKDCGCDGAGDFAEVPSQIGLTRNGEIKVGITEVKMKNKDKLPWQKTAMIKEYPPKTSSFPVYLRGHTQKQSNYENGYFIPEDEARGLIRIMNGQWAKEQAGIIESLTKENARLKEGYDNLTELAENLERELDHCREALENKGEIK